MKNVYAGIDIGTDSIKIAVCQLFNNKLNLLAATSVKSKGIKNGIVINDELAITSIKKAINEIEEMLGFEIKKVITSIPSSNANFLIATGKVDIDEEIGGCRKGIIRKTIPSTGTGCTAQSGSGRRRAGTSDCATAQKTVSKK